MKVVCIKRIPVFNINVGDIIDISLKSRYVNHYFIIRGKADFNEYPLNKDNFITMEEFRENQLEKLSI